MLEIITIVAVLVLVVYFLGKPIKAVANVAEDSILVSAKMAKRSMGASDAEHEFYTHQRYEKLHDKIKDSDVTNGQKGVEALLAGMRVTVDETVQQQYHIKDPCGHHSHSGGTQCKMQNSKLNHTTTITTHSFTTQSVSNVYVLTCTIRVNLLVSLGFRQVKIMTTPVEDTCIICSLLGLAIAFTVIAVFLQLHGFFTKIEQREDEPCKLYTHYCQ